ncbi:hypothetical protein [Sorangium sp. So ce1078]|uniref:hypothetical protein n=1 Tax=Sorangium sp. So ce1078 TaxID=3133329 RepID=UPI003F64457F
MHAYDVKDLAPSTGTAAVRGVATFLARLDALESSADPDRAGMKQSDKRAVAFLATRGLDKDERKRLGGLVDVALGPTSPLPEQTELPETARRREALSKLRNWFDAWSTTARAVIKKRGYLIRLGLANRKAPQRKPAAASRPSRASRSTTPTRPIWSNPAHQRGLPARARDLPARSGSLRRRNEGLRRDPEHDISRT